MYDPEVTGPKAYKKEVCEMSDNVKLIYDDKMERVVGGSVNPPWSDGMKPKHAGERCPDCGVCTLSFVQFQEYHGVKEEVDYCSNCDYIKFPI